MGTEGGIDADVVGEILERLYRLGPTVPLATMARNALSDHGITANPEQTSMIWDLVTVSDPNSSARLRFGDCLRKFDQVPPSGSLANTLSLSEERRHQIYDLLDVPSATRPIFDGMFPRYQGSDAPIVIAEKHKPWYFLPRQFPDFFWSSYRQYLKDTGQWPQSSLDDLNQAATEIVARLSDPSGAEAFPTRGVVVGYVQSGKTANFTAVIAKAADAGYRLVIVLAGTLDILRRQTQRRLDKELVGKEQIRRDLRDTEYDYFGAPDWNQFVSYRERELEPGYARWERMTGASSDYIELKQRVSLLKFPRLPGRPFNDPTNSSRAPCKLIVAKKNSKVLRRIVRDVMRIRQELADVPVLVIDDESDQASVAARPAKPTGEEKRPPVNGAIVDLLGALPRAQYLGYTATPFANVLIDREDKDDLFPRDFVISLKRPSGYMGVSDFFDLAPDLSDLQDDEKPQGYASNERALVEIIDERNDEARPALEDAILSFILAGAVKLYRKNAGTRVAAIAHHTMLVHESVRKNDHTALKAEVEGIFFNCVSDHESLIAGLRDLWAGHYHPVMSARSGGAVVPSNFEDLLPFVEECLGKIMASGAVRIVNSDPEHADDLPDFENSSVWSILVGGSKLSRGYTVEGLTITYYRRKIRTADALMQVGRWFGFRDGYRDLVRLFLDRDLFTDFKSICRDEEVFRRELRRYVDPSVIPPIRPKDVPPLVPMHKLPPTSAAKMRAAKVVHQNFGGQWKEPVTPSNIPADQASAAEGLRKILRFALHPLQEVELGTKDERVPSIARSKFRAVVFVVDRNTAHGWLKGLKWLSGEPILQRQLEFIDGATGRDPEIDRFLVVLPQTAQESQSSWRLRSGLVVSVFGRTQSASGAYNGFSEQRHRVVAEFLGGGRDLDQVTKDTGDLVRDRTAVILVYPVIPTAKTADMVGAVKDEEITLGFGIQYPKNHVTSVLTYGPGGE